MLARKKLKNLRAVREVALAGGYLSLRVRAEPWTSNTPMRKVTAA